MHQDVIRYKSFSTIQLLNDLEWIVHSPFLLKEELAEFKDGLSYDLIGIEDGLFFDDWLNELKMKPDKLVDFFKSEDQFILGKYFERLLHFFFENYPKYEVVEAGKQFIEGQITKGEIDFIVRDKTKGENIHFEVAVKYYMGYKNSSKHAMWIGPNGMDSLDKKMEKFSKQLDLSRRERTDVSIDRRLALLKGYFFLHRKSDLWPHFYNQKVENGSWMYLSEMGEGLDEDGQYLILGKKYWLSFLPEAEAIFESKKDIMIKVKDQITSIGKGIMLVHRDASSSDRLEKILIAPEKWPKL